MIEVVNLSERKIDCKLLKKAVECVLKGEKKEKKDISVAVLKEEEAKKANKKYRDINKATDVLSFSFDGGKDFITAEEQKDFLGEIIICPTAIMKGDFDEEITRVIIHGTLHLLGYEHEKNVAEAKIMESKQDYYFQKLWQKKKS